MAELGAGTRGRAEGLREPGKRRQLGPELRQVVKTEEVLAFKPQAQTIHKQLQVGGSTAGMLAMQIWPCNRSQLSLPAVPST